MLERVGLNRFGFGSLVSRNLAIFLKLLVIVTIWRGDLRRPFWRALIDIARHNPAALEVTILHVGLFLHFGEYAARMVRELDKRIAVSASAPFGRTQVGDRAASGGSAGQTRHDRPVGLEAPEPLDRP